MPHLHQTREAPAPTHYDEFLLFHRANPVVFELIVEFAREAKAAGAQTYGIGAIWELLRWHMQIKLKRTDFKLNNNFRSHYARFVMEQVPELDGFFEIRQLRS